MCMYDSDFHSVMCLHIANYYLGMGLVAKILALKSWALCCSLLLALSPLGLSSSFCHIPACPATSPQDLDSCAQSAVPWVHGEAFPGFMIAVRNSDPGGLGWTLWVLPLTNSLPQALDEMLPLLVPFYGEILSEMVPKAPPHQSRHTPTAPALSGPVSAFPSSSAPPPPLSWF